MYGLDNNKKRKYALVVMAVVLVVLVAMFVNRGSGIDVAPEEGSSTDYSAQARIVGGEELIKQLGGVGQYDSLGADLLVFGRKSFSEYRDHPTKVVGFELTSKNITKKDNKVEFEGRYGANKHKIAVVVTPLKNGRIHASITDKKTNTNIDAQLPSNTARDQFIGTLPVQKDVYSVSYVPATDSFLITLFEDGPANQAAAEKFLVTALTTNDLSQEKYQIVIPASAGGGSPIGQ